VKPVYSAEAEAYRAVIKAFLKENLPAGWRGMWALKGDERAEFADTWRAKLYENRLIAPAWPVKYGGGGLSPVERLVLAEEFTKVAAPPSLEVDMGGIGLLGPTLLTRGTEEQKTYFLPRILSGQDRWAQGYSEPEAGSDLASLRTRAELVDGSWVINGQKVWTSLAHRANWIFVLCRTDPSASQHRGISFLLVPLDQPGISIRPLINIVGTHEFNEVFFTDARTEAKMIVGQPNEGWSVANSLLGVERLSGATMYGVYKDELDRIIAMAKERRLSSDPIIRQRLAWSYSKVEILRYLGMKVATRLAADMPAGPESAVIKVLHTEYRKRVLDLAIDIMGLDATTPAGHRPYYPILSDVGAAYSSAGWVDMYLGAQPASIYAGTSEVHRNIIGERVLGLPREPRSGWQRAQLSVGA
jgi:alkylation response protein AidB-like acyl-CoA dehydrogenase